MLRLYAAANLQDAYLLLHLLAEKGVKAHVLNENAQGGLGEIPFTHTYPEIWIEDEADLPTARKVINVFEQRPSEPGEVKCPSCGEENPGNFEVCWRCNHPLT
jgi:hypothetical protein